MLIAEDLVLLLVDNDTGKPVTDHATLADAVGGAILADLALAGRVDLAAAGEDTEEGRLVVRDDTPTDNPVLDKVLARASQVKVGKRPETVLSTVAKGLWTELLDGLAERGILRRQERKVLHIFRTECWPTADARHEAEVRQRLDAVLHHDAEPDDRERALIGLLAATGTVTTGVPDASPAARARAKQVGQNVWAVRAVEQAMSEVTSAAFVSSASPGR